MEFSHLRATCNSEVQPAVQQRRAHREDNAVSPMLLGIVPLNALWSRSLRTRRRGGDARAHTHAAPRAHRSHMTARAPMLSGIVPLSWLLLMRLHA